ncbi:MAG: GNAT family N-acetyltransferase [Nitrososphaerales archaeon]
MLEIQRLPVERWREYRELRLEALRNDPTAFGSSPEEEERLGEEEWRRRIGNALFALMDGEPVGTVAVVFNDRSKTRHVADVFGVYVRPDRRGHGVGARLLEGALRLASEREGVVKVKLAVNPDQRAALGLYERAGFVVAGRLSKELKVGSAFYDELVMEKML